jgi:sulfur carrier protein ThiS
MACDEVDQALRLKVRLIRMIQQVEGLESIVIDTVMGEQKRIHSHFSHLAGLLKDREASLLHDLATEEARVKDLLKQYRLRLEAAAIAVDDVVVRAERTSSCASSLEVLQTSLGLVRDISSMREMAARAAHANLQARPSFPAIRFESQQSAEVALETMLSRHGGIATVEMPQSSLNRLLAALCRLASLCVRYLVMAVRNRRMKDDGE